MSYAHPYGHPRRGMSVQCRLLPIAVVVLLGACGDETIVPPNKAPETVAAAKQGRPKFDEGGLSIEGMLNDPLFQVLVMDIDEPGLAEPLLAAIDELVAGRRTPALKLIAKARAEADALEDGPLTEALIAWSAVERYFNAAGLL